MVKGQNPRLHAALGCTHIGQDRLEQSIFAPIRERLPGLLAFGTMRLQDIELTVRVPCMVNYMSHTNLDEVNYACWTLNFFFLG